jgi:hypothetical protein
LLIAKSNFGLALPLEVKLEARGLKDFLIKNEEVRISSTAINVSYRVFKDATFAEGTAEEIDKLVGDFVSELRSCVDWY